jgi:hypothetical protein
MKLHLAWLFVCAAAVVPARLFAKDVEKRSDASVGQLVRDLDDDNYFVRERALQRLTALGMPAVAALGDALVEGSPEASWRASAALEKIAIEGDESQMQQIAVLLKKLSRQKPHLGQLAKELAVRQQWARHKRAVAELRSLGGQVFTTDEELSGEGLADFGGVEMAVDAVPLAIEVVELEAEPAEEPKGIFGAIRAIARAFVPVLPDPEAPPEPIEVEPEAAPEAKPATPESPDVEIVGREKPRAADVEIIEEAAPEMEEAAADVELALAEFGLGGMIGVGGDVAQGVSQVTINRNWLGGDEGLVHLKNLKGLAAFTVEDARVSDAALPYLAAVPSLRQLTLRGGQFTLDGLRKWRKARPEVQIVAFGPAMMGVGADMHSSPLALNHIYPRSGAQEAGLAAGDVVKRIDGEEIRDFSDLMLAVYRRKVGDKLQVEFEREGKLRTVEVPLKSRQAVEEAAVEDPFR